MWVFTPFGFFSIVAHRDKPRHLLVRARDRHDLEALADRLRPKPAIASSPRADYAFRLVATRKAIGKLLASFAEAELDYPNFKTEVARQQGHQRAGIYHDVWDDLLPLQGSPSRREPDRLGGFPWE